MKIPVRIIPRLDIKGPNLVKGIHLEGLRVIGKPEEFAQYYYEQGADELIFQDVVASLYERNSLKDIISRIAERIFIPLTVGGGLRTIEDIVAALRAGADKVSINTAAIKNPGLIDESAKYFGSSTIVIAIEAIRQRDGEYLAYTDNGREHTGVKVIDWVLEAESRGAGEILLTSIDRDGTGKGFDKDLINLVSESVSIPVIAHGGPGTAEHVSAIINGCQVDAVALASMFHYGAINNQQDFSYHGEEGNVEFLKKNKGYTKFGISDPISIKAHLTAQNIVCRL
jgi:imidazole glycerol-phosphate synthase subunit HisF